MSPTGLARHWRGLVGVSVIALGLLACGYANAPNDSNTVKNPNLTACHVTSSDLALPDAGNVTAPQVAISGSKTLSIDGSTALTPLFTDAQQAFDNANGTQTTVNGNGSGSGLKDVASGAVQIGMSDVFAKEKESAPGQYASLTDHQVAGVIFTIVVSQDISSKIQNLTTQEIKDIFAGNTTNWAQIGGPDEPVNVIVRTSGSGTRATFDRYIIGDPKTLDDEPPGSQEADKTGELVSKISAAYGAIGYTATSFVLNTDQASKIFPVCIDGYGATAQNVASGKYRFWNIEHAYTKGEPAANSATGAFLAFVASPAFQAKALPKRGFLQLSQIPASVVAQYQVK